MSNREQGCPFCTTLQGMKSACQGAALLAMMSTMALMAQQPGYEDKFITLNGLRIHYLDWGSPDKPPFVMLHGISRIAHQFDHLAPHFRNDYHVMALDMRGHGDSMVAGRRLFGGGLCKGPGSVCRSTPASQSRAPGQLDGGPCRAGLCRPAPGPRVQADLGRRGAGAAQ